MAEHVHARCGEYHMLFPTQNVGLIETAPCRFLCSACVRGKMDRNAEVIVDLRRLLSVPAFPTDHAPATFEWRSTDGRRRAVLVVDAVEEIVECSAADLIPAPALPLPLRPLCDSVMRGPRGRFHLRVRLDVEFPARNSDLRRFVRSLMVRDLSGEGVRK